jgi:hypothetical protein
MDDEMRFRVPKDDKAAFEEAADQLRLSSVSEFMRQAAWEKIRNAGLAVGKGRERAAERQQRAAMQISMLRSWIREEPTLAKAGEEAIAVLEGFMKPPEEKRGKGGGR